MIFPVRYKIRSVVVVLPASMCAMIPIFRMRRTSSSADKGAASAAPCRWPSRKSAESPLALNARATAFLIVGPRGNSNDVTVRLWSTLLRPRESSSAIAWLLCCQPRAATRALPHVNKNAGGLSPNADTPLYLHNNFVTVPFYRAFDFNFRAVGLVGLRSTVYGIWPVVCCT